MLSQVFGIWNPNMMIPFLRCYQTLHHLRMYTKCCETNFVSFSVKLKHQYCQTYSKN